VTLGECQLLASPAKWTHIAGSHRSRCAIAQLGRPAAVTLANVCSGGVERIEGALLLAPARHVGVVLRHQRIPKAFCSACCPAAASTGTYST
jgi:hypothetical protein